MKTVIIYNSQTGFTKRYAQWIAKASGARCLAFSEAKTKNLDAFEAIIFGSWACAGRIRGLGWFKKQAGRWHGKKLIVFCVGANPPESPDIAPALQLNFTESELKKIRVFYCPGGLNYKKMSVPSKLMMKLFLTALKLKKGKTKAEQEVIKAVSSSYDISDKKYIRPVLECLKQKSVTGGITTDYVPSQKL